MKSKSYNKIAFGVILLLQIVCMIYFGNAKQGYFVDELWSYGLANSYYHPHVYSDDALEERWVSGEYFRDYLEVLPDQRFRYGSVVYKSDAGLSSSAVLYGITYNLITFSKYI